MLPSQAYRLRTVRSLTLEEARDELVRCYYQTQHGGNVGSPYAKRICRLISHISTLSEWNPDEVATAAWEDAAAMA